MPDTILIVDDDPASREALESILDGEGYHLEMAENGPQVFEKARRLLPDAILLDVMMPGMDGFEVCRGLRSDPQLAEVPILILTALDDQMARLEGLEAGADDFLTKPVNRHELRARIRTIIRLNRYRTLLEQRAQLEQMAARVLAAQETERNRIARELHDDLGQALTAHMLTLHNLRKLTPANWSQMEPALEELVGDTRAMLGLIRQLLNNLRPLALDTLGLPDAIRAYCYEYSRRTALPVDIAIDPSAERLADLQTITIYRILQEALTNIVKHANASAVSVQLEPVNRGMCLTVQDNGQGFNTDVVAPGSMGLTGIRERLELIGGHLQITSAPNKGVILEATLPS